jgi:hypothetical protein
MHEAFIDFAVELLGLPQPVRVRVSERPHRAAARVACGPLVSSGIGATSREALVAALAPLGQRHASEVMAAPELFAATAQLFAAREVV